VFNLGFGEMALIFVVALLVFGPNRLPELARSLGKGLAEFRRASNDLRRSILEADAEASAPQPPRGPADEAAATPLSPGTPAHSVPLALPQPPPAVAAAPAPAASAKPDEPTA
jgi:TatA/E family protein of Tat protein translocase